MISLDPQPTPPPSKPPTVFLNPAAFLKPIAKTKNFHLISDLSSKKMARAVAEAAASSSPRRRSRNRCWESYAYLVPALLTALERDTRCVISTYTITLQEQLFHKDVPRVQTILGTQLKTFS